MARVRVLVVLAAVAFLLLAGIASAEVPPACRFTGTVMLDGAEVAGGTLITAIIEGDEYYTHTPTGYGYSMYAITIQPPESMYYPEGTPVHFKINGHAAHQTGTFQARENIRLDLTASSTPTPTANPSPEPGSPTNVWLIVGLVIACIAEASVVGGVAVIVFSNWNR